MYLEFLWCTNGHLKTMWYCRLFAQNGPFVSGNFFQEPILSSTVVGTTYLVYIITKTFFNLLMFLKFIRTISDINNLDDSRSESQWSPLPGGSVYDGFMSGLTGKPLKRKNKVFDFKRQILVSLPLIRPQHGPKTPNTGVRGRSPRGFSVNLGVKPTFLLT